MESKRSFATFGSQSHFHIRWSGFELDWLTFPTEEEATTKAERLKRPGDSYTIEHRDANCERCKELLAKVKARANARPNGSGAH